MHVNPISNFSISHAYRNNNIQNNQQVPAMKHTLNADTVSFSGKGDKQKKHDPLNDLVLATVLTGAIATGAGSCTPDYESYTSLENSTIINLRDYHHCCGHDSIPFIIVRDTIHDTDTLWMPQDTLWLKPDTVYIPKKPHFEINDSINKDIDDFDIPTEGEGDFVYAFKGRNEYLGAQHLMVFNGFFSSEKKSSFVDHAFEEDDVPAGGGEPSKYYYTRYDISTDYINGRRFVEMYIPRESRHILPNDKQTGSAGWQYAGCFYVQNASVAGTAQLIANDMAGTLQARITNNDHRGSGNLYKEWRLDDGSMPKTTIEQVKAYKVDLDDLE